jgi:hypothetical protein
MPIPHVRIAIPCGILSKPENFNEPTAISIIPFRISLTPGKVKDSLYVPSNQQASSHLEDGSTTKPILK